MSFIKILLGTGSLLQKAIILDFSLDISIVNLFAINDKMKVENQNFQSAQLSSAVGGAASTLPHLLNYNGLPPWHRGRITASHIAVLGSFPNRVRIFNFSLGLELGGMMFQNPNP